MLCAGLSKFGGRNPDNGFCRCRGRIVKGLWAVNLEGFQCRFSVNPIYWRSLFTQTVFKIEYTKISTMNNHAIDFAKNAIQQFLADRPDSADTLDGIHAWWIRWPELPEHINVTLAALEQLEALGIMETAVVGQRTIWRKRR